MHLDPQMNADSRRGGEAALETSEDKWAHYLVIIFSDSLGFRICAHPRSSADSPFGLPHGSG